MESLSVKYRPKTFEEIVSQETIIRILTRMVSSGDVKNTYLFAGPSGCGKTTIARAFANLINKGVGSPIEIDGASNNGVENVKSIVKSASERSVDSEYKIYIIDECHMLTTAAWNAFLKCIEEPPRYTIFMFATTDPQKIPSTILNRVMRFNLTRISYEKIRSRLEYICSKEGFTNYCDSCDYIARISNGQMRDAIANLEKCASYDTNISLDNCLNALGNYSYSTYFDILNSIIDGNMDSCIAIFNKIYADGIESKLFVDQLLTFVLDVCKYAICESIEVTKIPNTYLREVERCVAFDSPIPYFCYLSDSILNLKNMIKTDTDPKTTIEVNLIKMCRCM